MHEAGDMGAGPQGRLVRHGHQSNVQGRPLGISAKEMATREKSLPRSKKKLSPPGARTQNLDLLFNRKRKVTPYHWANGPIFDSLTHSPNRYHLPSPSDQLDTKSARLRRAAASPPSLFLFVAVFSRRITLLSPCQSLLRLVQDPRQSFSHFAGALLCYTGRIGNLNLWRQC